MFDSNPLEATLDNFDEAIDQQDQPQLLYLARDQCLINADVRKTSCSYSSTQTYSLTDCLAYRSTRNLTVVTISRC